MLARRIWIAVAAILLLLVAASFTAPVIVYTRSVDIPFAYRAGTESCSPAGGVVNATNQAEYAACLASFKYPPATVTGSAAIGYRLWGIGSSPFPSQMLVTQGNYSVLVYFDGDRISAAEDLSPLGGAGFGEVSIDPQGVVAIQNASIEQTAFGLLNVTVVLKNIGGAPIAVAPIGAGQGFGAAVSIQGPGLGFNMTYGGLTWIVGDQLGLCPSPFSPGKDCSVSATSPDTLPTGSPFAYYVEVRGMTNGTAFFYRERFTGQHPSSGITSNWVHQFIQQVDLKRSGPGLTENSTLDQFASLRFTTAASQPDISDFGLASDASSFFAANTTPVIEEVLLFPGDSNPISYAYYLKTYAPGHWAALESANFTQFGYHIGTGPYESVDQPCPVSEIPRGGLNITQFFEQAGCSVTVQQATWLVIILSE